MIQTEIEWLNEGHEFDEVTHYKNYRGKKELDNEGFDNVWAQSMGYEDIEHCTKHNYIQDKLCIIQHGNYCKRNK